MCHLDSVDVWAHPELFQLDGGQSAKRGGGMSAGWIFCRRTAVGQSPV